MPWKSTPSPSSPGIIHDTALSFTRSFGDVVLVCRTATPSCLSRVILLDLDERSCSMPGHAVT